jgi:hypothetical protein
MIYKHPKTNKPVDGRSIYLMLREIIAQPVFMNNLKDMIGQSYKDRGLHCNIYHNCSSMKHYFIFDIFDTNYQRKYGYKINDSGNSDLPRKFVDSILLQYDAMERSRKIKGVLEDYD